MYTKTIRQQKKKNNGNEHLLLVNKQVCLTIHAACANRHHNT